MKRTASSAAPYFARAQNALAPLRARWAGLSARERYFSTLAIFAVAILLVWAVALAPALASLQKVQTRRALLDGQLQQVLALQAEARQLAAQPKIGREASLRALRESVAALGSGAQLQTAGERAIVNLQGVPAANLAAWLGQARTNARAVPFEMRLVRSQVRTPAASPGSAANRNPQYRPALPSPGTPGVQPPGSAMADAAQNTPMPTIPATAPADVRWDGSVVLILPAG
jgi:general secretion pathway protein M